MSDGEGMKALKGAVEGGVSGQKDVWREGSGKVRKEKAITRYLFLFVSWTEHGTKLVSGEWDEQLKIGWCMEDPSRQQRPETGKRKRELTSCLMERAP